jgi:hypothetical protein
LKIFNLDSAYESEGTMIWWWWWWW